MRKAVATPEGLTYIDMSAKEELAFDASRQRVPTIQDYTLAIQAVIDETAAAREYTDGTSLAGYVASTIPAWQDEALAFVAWRDSVWTYAYQELGNVQEGKRAAPSVKDFLTELPALTWPT